MQTLVVIVLVVVAVAWLAWRTPRAKPGRAPASCPRSSCLGCPSASPASSTPPRADLGSS